MDTRAQNLRKLPPVPVSLKCKITNLSCCCTCLRSSSKKEWMQYATPFSKKRIKGTDRHNRRKKERKKEHGEKKKAERIKKEGR